MNKLLFWLSGFLPCRLIDLDSGPYLERYYIGQLFGVTFYLHRFVSSDTERHLHNHPWKWGRALVLSGGYLEESVIDLCPFVDTATGCLTESRRIRWWNRVNGNHFHRISDAKPGTWTLFFHGPRQKVTAQTLASKAFNHVTGVMKGWGFLEYDRDAGQDVTVFRPYPSAQSRWWEEAPQGNEINRVPLKDDVTMVDDHYRPEMAIVWAWVAFSVVVIGALLWWVL